MNKEQADLRPISQLQKNTGNPYGNMGAIGASAIHMALNKTTVDAAKKSAAERATFINELQALFPKHDRIDVSDFTSWLKRTPNPLPDAVFEKLYNLLLAEYPKCLGWGGNAESKAFVEALLKFMKMNSQLLFAAAYTEISEWSQLADQLSTKLVTLEGQDTSAIMAKLDTATAKILELATQKTANEGVIETQKLEIDRLQKKLTSVEDEKAKAQKDLEKLQESERKLALDKNTVDQDLLASKALVIRLEGEKSEAKAEITTLKEGTAVQFKQEAEIAKLRAEVDGYKQRLEDANKRIAHLEKQDANHTENQKEFAAFSQRQLAELTATRQDLNSSRVQLENSMSQSFSGKKGGNGGYAVPAPPALRDTQPPHNTSAALSRGSKGHQLTASTPQTQQGFFQAAVVPQAVPVPAPNLLTLEVVCLPVSKTETTNQADILKYIDYIRTKNVISDTRLKAFIAIARFLNAFPTISDQDPVYKFAIESAKQLATHDTGSPNNPIKCLNAILGHSTAVKALTKEPSFQQLCDELTKLSKEPSRSSSAETLNASRLHGGLRNLFENDAFNIVVLKDYFRAQKLVFEAKEKETAAPEAKEKETAAPEAKPNDSADVSRNTSTMGRSGGQ